MRLEASQLVESASRELGIRLADLVALASVWVAPDVYRLLEPVGGIWHPDRRRANLGLRVDGKSVEAVGQVIEGITLDNNTYANTAFKNALGVDRHDFVGFHICHIWAGTAYDPACYTHIANLVAIPAELASLTDHHPHIVACLRYRSYELYGWKPKKEIAPVKPADYPDRWREPWPVSDAARRAVTKRCRGETRDLEPTASASDDLKVTVPEKRYQSGDEVTEAAIVAAFYLSRFDHERLRLGNQGETIDAIAKSLGINRNTLRQQRDYFDSHTGSYRQGWKAALPPQLESVFRELMPLDEETLRARVIVSIRKG